MALKLDIGDRFPDVELTDEREHKRSLSSIADGQPTILALFRGPW